MNELFKNKNNDDEKNWAGVREREEDGDSESEQLLEQLINFNKDLYSFIARGTFFSL